MGYLIYVAMQHGLSEIAKRLRLLRRRAGAALLGGARRPEAAANATMARERERPLPKPVAGHLWLRQRLALALQGGGAHGAFTWGVLDRLLEDGNAAIVAISGASAGAINGCVLAAGMLEGGPQTARERLDRLWRRLAELARFSPLRPTPFERLVLGRNSEWSFSHVAFDLVSRLYSPYQLNPLGLSPLRRLLVELIDFERLSDPAAIRLVVAATSVETGAARLFENAELSPDVLLASACLPTLYPAVKLDDGHYWDGGFTANPPLLPLVEAGGADDILIVRTNPTEELGVPTSARGIQARLSRIVFDSPLKRELEGIAWLRRAALKEGAALPAGARRLASLRLHSIGDDDVLAKLGNASKLHPDWPLVQALKEAGRSAAERWLVTAAWRRHAANDDDAGTAGLAV